MVTHPNVCLRIKGAGTVPDPGGIMALSASYPFVTVEADATTIRVLVKLKSILLVFRLLIARTHDSDRTRLEWTATWGDIDHVIVGHRSVVLVRKHGRSCRFATLTRRRILPLLALIEEAGVPTKRVRTTVGWTIKI